MKKNTTNIRKHNQGNLPKNKKHRDGNSRNKVKIRESAQKIQHPINSRKKSTENKGEKNQEHNFRKYPRTE